MAVVGFVLGHAAVRTVVGTAVRVLAKVGGHAGHEGHVALAAMHAGLVDWLGLWYGVWRMAYGVCCVALN